MSVVWCQDGMFPVLTAVTAFDRANRLVADSVSQQVASASFQLLCGLQAHSLLGGVAEYVTWSCLLTVTSVPV
jgi:hypothetical protein